MKTQTLVERYAKDIQGVLEFDVVAGAPVSPERFAGAAESVKTNTANFLAFV